MNAFDWPLTVLPELAISGRFGLSDRDHTTTYQGRTHALHLHGYRGGMRLAGESIEIAPGDVTLSPAGWPSSYDVDAPGHHWVIHFVPTAAPATVPIALVTRDAASLRERFAHVASLHAVRDDPIAAAQARLAAQELLLTLAEHDRPTSGPAERAAAFIDANFAEDVGVREIAAAAGRSPAHLARVFRRRFGTTMPHRLVQRRAEHARYLLESTDLPIWRVAERVGIADAQHFNKTLRRLLGASPTTIRAAAAGPKIDPDR